MKKIEIYTLNYCPYCKMALETLKKENVAFENYDITKIEGQTSKELKDKYNIEGEVTYPQIIVDGVRFGGNDKLQEAIQDKEFDKIFR